jgi:hypothetical protein
MAHFTVGEVNALTEATKLNITQVDPDLEDEASAEVIGRLATVFDTSGWADETTTPKLVRKVMAMLYVAYLYNKTYAESEEGVDTYAATLLRRAQLILDGIQSGVYILVDDPDASDTPGQPVFYPTDDSSALDPRDFPDDTSVGPAKFSMGMVF